MVRKPRTLQRLREPAATRPELRPERLRHRSADRAEQGHRAGPGLEPVRNRGGDLASVFGIDIEPSPASASRSKSRKITRGSKTTPTQTDGKARTRKRSRAG